MCMCVLAVIPYCVCVRVRRAILYIRCARRASVLLSECHCLVKRCYVSRVCSLEKYRNGRTRDSTDTSTRPRLPTSPPPCLRTRTRRTRARTGYRGRCGCCTRSGSTCASRCSRTRAKNAMRRETRMSRAPRVRERAICFFSPARPYRTAVYALSHSLTLPPPVRRPHDQPSLYVPHALQGVQHMPLTTVRALQLSLKLYYSSHGRLASRVPPRAFSQHVRRGD